MNFFSKIAREIQYEGWSGFIASLPSHLRDRVRGLRYPLMRHRLLENDEFEAYVEGHGRSWAYTDGCRQTIGNSNSRVPDTFRTIDGTYDIGPSRVYELSDATLVGPHAVAITDSGKIPLCSVRNKRSKFYRAIQDGTFSRGWNHSGSPRTFDVVFPLVLPKASFFVWLTEYLPKLQAYQAYRDEAEVPPHIVIKADPPTWMVESLECLGVPEERIIEMPSDSIRADSVVLSTHRYHNIQIDYNPHCRAEYEWLANRMRDAIDNPDGPERVYISREDANRRQIINQEEVKDLLAEFGFEKVTLSSMNFANQVQSVADADVIVGIHGAGLAHMLWAHNPAIIEIVPETYQRPTFFALSQILEYGYESISASTPSLDKQPKERDIIVDPELIREILIDLE